MSITQRERHLVENANASGKTPVVLIHGLWVLASWSDASPERVAGLRLAA